MSVQHDHELCADAPSFVADAVTPTSSAGEFNGAKLMDLKSPLARGDTASMMGHPDDNDVTDTSLSLSLPTEVTSTHTASGPAPPAWLTGLLSARLFEQCPHHPGVRKNETNFFCLGCTPTGGRGMCKHCLPGHGCCGASARSPVFQVRRYMYQNVVHVDDISPLYEVSGVQAYCINGKRAVLIAPKPPAPGANGAPVFANRCRGCAIPLRPDCGWCSLACKVEAEYGLAPRTPHELDLAAARKGVFTAGGSPSKGTHLFGAHAHHQRKGGEWTWVARSGLQSSRGSPSDASTATRAGVKRRKVDSPQRAALF